jgi:hypothetical protein
VNQNSSMWWPTSRQRLPLRDALLGAWSRPRPPLAQSPSGINCLLCIAFGPSAGDWLKIGGHAAIDGAASVIESSDLIEHGLFGSAAMALQPFSLRGL